MLNIDRVSKSFGDRNVLKGLDLTIDKGTIFGLVGVNGAGKSTLLRCIAGIYRCDEGRVLFCDEDTYINEKIRKDIFLVNDDPYYPLAADIRSLKEFYASCYDIDEKAYLNALEMFHLDEKKTINSFSKGMKRQTLLLFALAIRPKLLLLDEAFDGLDPIVRYDLRRSLYEFMQESGATVIISSHNLKELEDICDSYGILEDGRISTFGDLLESKQNINKYQLAFKEGFDESFFEQFDVVRMSKEGSVYSLVIRGNRDEIVEKLKEADPLILDTLQVNFEELFIYEHEGGRKDA